MQNIIWYIITFIVFLIFRYKEYSKYKKIKFIIKLSIIDFLFFCNPILVYLNNLLIHSKKIDLLVLLLIFLYIISKHIYFKKNWINTWILYIIWEILVFLFCIIIFSIIVFLNQDLI